MKKKLLSVLFAALTALSCAVSAAGYEVDEEKLPELANRLYGYNDMEKRSNTEARQTLYKLIYDIYLKVWNAEADITDYVSGFYVIDVINFSALGLTADEAVEVYYCVRDDNPLFYFIPNTCPRNETHLFLTTEYSFISAATRRNARNKIINYLNGKLTAIEQLDSSYDIARMLHDLINSDAEYAYVLQDGEYVADPLLSAHSIWGIIEKGRGVCESYAKLFQLLLNLEEIENVLVIGSGNSRRHAWNIVQLDDGNFYNFDLTWDDSNSYYKYFAKGSASFDINHTPDSCEDHGTEFQYELPLVSTEDYYKFLPGDADGDGNVNMQDYALMQRYLSSWKVTIALKNCDLNGDGEVNMLDYALMQRKLAGWDIDEG